MQHLLAAAALREAAVTGLARLGLTDRALIALFRTEPDRARAIILLMLGPDFAVDRGLGRTGRNQT